MNSQYDEFLFSNAFEPEEFEHSQMQFENAAAVLGEIFSTQLAEVMRTNLQKEISEEWVSAADEILGSILSQPPSYQCSQNAILEMRQCLKSKPLISETTIDAEIRNFGEECAQLILARWYAELHTLSIPSEGVALNANMLPGTRSIEEILKPLDFEAFGVTNAMLALAIRAYREMLVMQAVGGVIEFAPQLFLIFDVSNNNQPFQCFKSLDDATSAKQTRAWLLAQTSADMQTEVQNHQLSLEKRNHLIDVLEAVRRATLPDSSATGMNISILADAVGFFLGEIPAWPSYSSQHLNTNYKSHYFAPHSGAEKLLQESVGLGVDIFSAGMSADLHQAKSLLRSHSAPIRDLLFCYADARDVKVSAVADIYAIAVVVGVECQFRQFVGKSTMLSSLAHEDLKQAFVNAHGVSSHAATQLVDDSRTGTAYISCPLG